MYCHKCGTEMPDDSLFCRKCGAGLQLGDSAIPKSPHQATKSPFATDVGKVGCLLGWFALAPYLLPILGFIIICLFVVANTELPKLQYQISRSQRQGDFQAEWESYLVSMLSDKAGKSNLASNVNMWKSVLIKCKYQPKTGSCSDEVLDEGKAFFPARNNFLTQIRTSDSRQTYKQKLPERYRLAVYRDWKWRNWDDNRASQEAAQSLQLRVPIFDSGFAELEEYVRQNQIQILDKQQFRLYLIRKGYSPDEVSILLDTVEP